MDLHRLRSRVRLIARTAAATRQQLAPTACALLTRSCAPQHNAFSHAIPEGTAEAVARGCRYDAAKDGGGVPFESLPDTWVCPVCGAAKSAYKQSVAADGTAQWVHEHSVDEKAHAHAAGH